MQLSRPQAADSCSDHCQPKAAGHGCKIPVHKHDGPGIPLIIVILSKLHTKPRSPQTWHWDTGALGRSVIARGVSHDMHKRLPSAKREISLTDVSLTLPPSSLLQHLLIWCLQVQQNHIKSKKQLSNGLVWRCQCTRELWGKADVLLQPNYFSSTFVPWPTTADSSPGGPGNPFPNPRSSLGTASLAPSQRAPSPLGTAVPTFLGGDLHPGGRQPAEPVLGDLHQALGRGAFQRRRRFPPQGVFLPEMEVAFQRHGGRGAVLLICRGTVKGNTTQLEESREVTEMHLVPLPRAEKRS